MREGGRIKLQKDGKEKRDGGRVISKYIKH